MVVLESDLGGPNTATNWRKYFVNDKRAKEYAKRDYKKQGGPEHIQWKAEKGGWKSQDLLFVIYYIKPVKVEK